MNPRGDRLLTELTIRALKELRPRLIMVNYNDPDYVHWGNMTHYTRGVAVIDEGLRQLVATVEAEPVLSRQYGFCGGARLWARHQSLRGSAVPASFQFPFRA